MIITEPGKVSDTITLLGRPESCVSLVDGGNELALLGGSAVTTAYRDQAFAINVGGTENLIKACQATGVKRLIHTSSVDVCFNSEVNLINYLPS